MEQIEHHETHRLEDSGETLAEHAADGELHPPDNSPHEDYNDGFDDGEYQPAPITPKARRRILTAIGLIAFLGVLAVLPPLMNVSRYRHRIANSISASLGRPVHIDSVTLTVLPMPGFVLTNFVVDEDPAFGSEPVIRANTVRATLRMRSLWRGQVEFSTITLDEPSVNLVHRQDGRWNVESILLQASRMNVLPTEQKQAGGVQRFPYIEATGARVNLKRGLEKMPLSLIDASFALWLPKPMSWRIRMEAHPSRTDTAASDTGVLKVEGTLGKADMLENVPVDLTAEWSSVPLGAASWVTMGRDAELRGDMTLRAILQGTVGTANVTSKLELRRLRRAEFVPAEPLNVDLSCTAQTVTVFHSVEDLRCVWPTADGTGGLEVTGNLPEVRHPLTGDLVAKWTNVPASAILDAARVASQGISPHVRAGGAFSGEFDCCSDTLPNSRGSLEASHAMLALTDAQPTMLDGPLTADLDGAALEIAPFAVDLGGPQPALLAIQADASGLRMQLVGTIIRSRLTALEQAIPQFGDGLEGALPDAATDSAVPVKVDLTSNRPWGAIQTWRSAAAMPSKRRHRHR